MDQHVFRSLLNPFKNNGKSRSTVDQQFHLITYQHRHFGEVFQRLDTACCLGCQVAVDTDEREGFFFQGFDQPGHLGIFNLPGKDEAFEFGAAEDKVGRYGDGRECVE